MTFKGVEAKGTCERYGKGWTWWEEGGDLRVTLDNLGVDGRDAVDGVRSDDTEEGHVHPLIAVLLHDGHVAHSLQVAGPSRQHQLDRHPGINFAPFACTILQPPDQITRLTI